MWVLGLYKLSWPANGSFVYVIFLIFFIFVCLFVCLRRKTGKRGSCGRGSIYLYKYSRPRPQNRAVPGDEANVCMHAVRAA